VKNIFAVVYYGKSAAERSTTLPFTNLIPAFVAKTTCPKKTVALKKNNGTFDSAPNE
jgi:hypothetical protein